MRPEDKDLAERLQADLSSFDSQCRGIPGVKSSANRAAFVEQLVESVRRIKYISVINSRKLSQSCIDASSNAFDPIKAAVICRREGRTDEAFWLVFLSVHFGKHRLDGWRLTQDIYGRLGEGPPWDWAETSAHPRRFRQWLADHQSRLKGDGITRRFGNHRKYQSLDAYKPVGTGAAFEGYIEWVGPHHIHQELFEKSLGRCGHDPKAAFGDLYRSMDVVVSFGRTARFDYLTMVGKLGLAPIEPGSTYMLGATGPLLGARLLFGGTTDAVLSCSQLEAWLVELGSHLGVGMQVLEDALCNWQKSPPRFQRFRG